VKAKWYTKETISDINVQDRNFPQFRVGDTIALSQRIKEGNKERLQVFQGDVIAMHKNGISTTFTVRKIGAHGIPVERIFPYYSPLVQSIKLISRGSVRRAKLYYIRDRVGKAARLKEKVISKSKLKQKNEAKQPDDVSTETV